MSELQDLFEQGNPIPKGVTRCGDHYAQTEYMLIDPYASNYAARFKGFMEGIRHQQTTINDLKSQLECCRRENAVLLGKVGDGERRISFLEMNIKYVLDHFDMNDLDKAMPRVYEDLKEALRGKHD